MRWSQQWKDLGKHNPGRRNSKLRSSRISLAILKERKKPEEPEGRNWTCKNLGKNIPVEGTVDVQAVRTAEPTAWSWVEDQKGPLMLKQRREEAGAGQGRGGRRAGMTEPGLALKGFWALS